MNIRQLHYFLAVATELNFTRAALRIGISQPPLSQQIIALEQELGTPLFTREKRKVQLTPAGEVLIEHARRVINAAAAATDAVRKVQRGTRSSISVGAVYSAIYSFLPQALNIFAASAPNTEVNLQEMTIAQQMAALKEDVIDVGLLRGPIYDREIKTEVLFREILVVAAPASSGFVAGQPITIRDLADQPLIAVARGNSRSYSDRVLEAFETQSVVPRIAHEVSDMHTAVCLVAAGLGVSIVPAIIQVMRTQGVVYCPLTEPAPWVSLALAWRKSSSSPLITKFFEAARASADSLRKEHPKLLLPIEE